MHKRSTRFCTSVITWRLSEEGRRVMQSIGEELAREILFRLLTSFRELAPWISGIKTTKYRVAVDLLAYSLHGRDSFCLRNTTQRRSKQFFSLFSTVLSLRDL